MSDQEFSVYLFFEDDSCHAEKRWVDALTAVECAAEMASRPAATAGIIQRIIITDGGDCTVFEWQHGQGVTVLKLVEQ